MDGFKMNHLIENMDCDFIEIGTSNFDTEIQSCHDDCVGISVEPLEVYLNDLPDKPHVIKFPAAISNTSGELDIYYMPPEIIDQHCTGSGGLRGCNSLGAPHPTAVRIFESMGLSHLIETKKVQTVTFGQLIKKFDVRSIRYLKIDTEGHDTIILESMMEYYDSISLDPDSKLWPEKIRFESNVLSDQDTIINIISKLEQRGYLIKERTSEDTVLVRMTSRQLDRRLNESDGRTDRLDGRLNRKSIDPKLIRIMVLVYDLSDIEKWECGKRMQALINQMEEYKSDDIELEIKAVTYRIRLESASKIFDDEFGPDLIITQQFAIEQAKMLSLRLDVPLIVVIYYNVNEFLNFYPELDQNKLDQPKLDQPELDQNKLDHPDLICCWTEELKRQLDRLAKISIPRMTMDKFLDPESKFWDIASRKISIIVPCHGEHIQYLTGLLENFNRFTLKPYEVVISVSMKPGQDTSQVNDILTNLKRESQLNIRLYLSYQALTAAQNRNLAAHRSRGDILVFLDSDDEYHPKLVEVINQVWKTHNPVGLYWSYIEPPKQFDDINLDHLNIVDGETIYKDMHNDHKYFDTKNMKDMRARILITNGHMAMRRDAWKECPWSEIIGGEDCLLNFKISWIYKYRIIWMNNALSLYHRVNSIGLDHHKEL